MYVLAGIQVCTILVTSKGCILTRTLSFPPQTLLVDLHCVIFLGTTRLVRSREASNRINSVPLSVSVFSTDSGGREEGRDAKDHENSGMRSCTCQRLREPAICGNGWGELRTRKLYHQTHIFCAQTQLQACFLYPTHFYVRCDPIGYMRVTMGRRL